MKRTALFLLMIALCATLCACGKEAAEEPGQANAPEIETPAVEELPEEIVVDAPASYDPVVPIELSTFTTEISDVRRAALDAPAGFEKFSEYLVDDPETEDLVSADEIALMRNGSGEKPETITYEQAVYDADLLARTLKVGYGAYYVFGEETFDKAHADTMAWLNGKTSISVSEFDAVLQKNYYFMRDAHASVAPAQEDIDGIRRDDCWTYFYCEDAYQQDENGFYKLSGSEKWYYDGCENDSVTMQPSLTESGEVVYSPVQFCSTTEMEPTSTIRLCCGDVVAYEEVSWTAGNPYPNGEGGYFLFDTDYRLEQAGGITYISLRNTDHERFPNEFSRFIKSGTTARDSNAVILDIRSNTGGGSDAIYKWFKNFTGTDLELRMASAVRGSVLNGLSDGASTWQQENITDGTLVPNDIPVFVLVDDCTGSGGEILMQALRMVENTVIVGSNTKGCILCGNVGKDMAFKLPHSQVHFNFGATLSYYNKLENPDDVGFAPDIWCDPVQALERALKLISSAGLAEDEACGELAGNLYELSLRWYADFHMESFGHPYVDIPANRNFGDQAPGVYTYRLDVRANGQRVTGFTILEVSNPDAAEMTISEDGDLMITIVGPGDCPFTIGYQGSTASFTWRSGSGPLDPIPPAQGSHKLTLRWYHNGIENKSSYDTINAGSGFGTSGGTQYIEVWADGKRVTDFDILDNTKPETCKLTCSEDGYLMLKVTGPGVSVFTIGYEDSTASFPWFSGEGPQIMDGPDEITLIWFRKYSGGVVKEVHIEPGEGFGDPKRGLQDMVVLLNGEPTTDFSVESSNPNSPVSVSEEGHIVLDNGVGESWLTVTCGDSFGRFCWGGAAG